MTAHRFEGRCHCGNIGFAFEASAPLDALGLRACQCSFCRAHNARTTSDPAGMLALCVRDPSLLTRYRFGLHTADFLICARCGVYAGAMLIEQERAWMTVNANAFRPPPAPDFPVAPAILDAENAPSRLARRKARWTPVSDRGI